MSMIDKEPNAEVCELAAVEQVSHAAASLARRRRFIKFGASTVPVTMTLASRPVMAWHCYTTSAWGSTQQANQVASVVVRMEKSRSNGNECWYISNWVGNTMYSPANSLYKPWRVLADSRYSAVAYWSSKDDTQRFTYAKLNCTLANIFPLGCAAVGSSALKVWDVLQGTDNFAKSVIVARLNTLYTNTGAQSVINACIASNGTDQVQEMARLGSNYASQNAPGVYWSKDDIRQYLHSNYLARFS